MQLNIAPLAVLCLLFLAEIETIVIRNEIYMIIDEYHTGTMSPSALMSSGEVTGDMECAAACLKDESCLWWVVDKEDTSVNMCKTYKERIELLQLPSSGSQRVYTRRYLVYIQPCFRHIRVRLTQLECKLIDLYECLFQIPAILL